MLVQFTGVAYMLTRCINNSKGHEFRNRHRFGLSRAPWTLLALILLLTCSVTAQGAPPNFVIIMADDMGYADASCYGNTAYTMPALDRLAREGMRFTDFHSSGTVCSPTRAGLLTGRYQQRAGIPGVVYAGFDQNRHHGLFPSEVTFPERLNLQGYTCGVFGKWHLGYDKRYNPVHHGFDRFHGYVSGNIDYISHFDRMEVADWWQGLELVAEEGYSTHLISKHAGQFIEQNRDRPFCVYVAHEAPHSPYQGPNDPPVRGPDKQKPVGKTDIPRAYREMMEEMDRGIGEVVETIDRLGLGENTLIFFLSDNGGTPSGSNGPLRGFKGQVWEGGHRVPAVARWPGRIPAGVVCEQTAISLDLMPTVLELAGADVPRGHQLDGVSLVPALLREDSLGERKLFWQYNEKRAMRDGPWKLVVGEKGMTEPALFHLGNDLGENDDLATTQSQRVERMVAEIETWYEEVLDGATQQPEKAEE